MYCRTVFAFALTLVCAGAPRDQSMNRAKKTGTPGLGVPVSWLVMF